MCKLAQRWREHNKKGGDWCLIEFSLTSKLRGQGTLLLYKQSSHNLFPSPVHDESCYIVEVRFFSPRSASLYEFLSAIIESIIEDYILGMYQHHIQYMLKITELQDSILQKSVKHAHEQGGKIARTIVPSSCNTTFNDQIEYETNSRYSNRSPVVWLTESDYGPVGSVGSSTHFGLNN